MEAIDGRRDVIVIKLYLFLHQYDKVDPLVLINSMNVHFFFFLKLSISNHSNLSSVITG